jgi:hypothetical protein
MLYNFYIDKRKNNKDDSFVDIILEYPIDIVEGEYLKVKLVDFKFLNNIYNISTSFANNQFNIRRYSKTYTYVYGGSELFLTNTGFFDDQNALLVDEVIDIPTHQSTITYDDTSLTYYNTADITDDTISYWENILTDTADVSRKMKLHDTYIYFIEITSNERITSFDCVFYKDTYVGGSTTDVDIILQKYNTSTLLWDTVQTNTITFQNSVPQEQISSTFTTTTPEPNDKYRITSNTASIPFTLYILKLQADKQIPIFDEGTIDTPVEHTITIPDGFYKASTYKNTLNDLLTNYKITTSIDPLNNKIKFSNDNITFVPTIDSLIDSNYQLDLVIPNIPNILENLGITNSYQNYIPLPFNSYYESDTHINLINLSKIIITTDLNFTKKTHNEIIRGNDQYRGIGNILCWLDADQAPFSCIKYNNWDDLSYKVENKHITSIRLSFYTEKSQEIYIDNGLFHLQIKKLNKKYL